METIFDIFGSRDSIKQPTLNPISQRLPGKVAPPSEGVLPGKQNIRNERPTTKGKRVLGDVGNKIKGSINKSGSNSDNSIKKVVQSSNIAVESSPKDHLQNGENIKHGNIQEETLTPQSTWIQSTDFNDVDKLPEVETQGSSFWNNDTCEFMWPQAPTLENLCNAANIWDIGMKYTPDHSPSRLSEDFDDNLDICLDLPSTSATEIMLEDVSVQFPWEM